MQCRAVNKKLKGRVWDLLMSTTDTYLTYAMSKCNASETHKLLALSKYSQQKLYPGMGEVGCRQSQQGRSQKVMVERLTLKILETTLQKSVH